MGKKVCQLECVKENYKISVSKFLVVMEIVVKHCWCQYFGRHSVLPVLHVVRK